MRREQIFNKQSLKEARKELRSNGTKPEALLWLRLKNRQLCGKRFRRQYSVGNYILDFYCPTERLAVELDGDHHFSKTGHEADIDRDEYLRDFGIRTLRFENRQVLENIEEVLLVIKENICNN